MVDTLAAVLAALVLVDLAPQAGSPRARMVATVGCVLMPAVLDGALVLLGPTRFALGLRTWTHSWALLPVWALAATTLAWTLDATPRGGAGQAPLGWAAGTALALAAGAVHLGLDVAGCGGAALAWPLDSTVVTWGWLPEHNPVPLLILAAGLVVPLGGVGRPRAATAAVMALGLYVGMMGGLAKVAARQAKASALAEDLDPRVVVVRAESALGRHWHTVVLNLEVALVRPVDIPGPVRAGRRLARGLDEPLVEELWSAGPGRAWRQRAAAPVAGSEALPEGGYEVLARDLARATRFLPSAAPAPYDLRVLLGPGGQLQDVQVQLPTGVPPLVLGQHSHPPRSRVF